jgi:c-di-GMP-binding flagellar brake protein YcgR
MGDDKRRYHRIKSDFSVRVKNQNLNREIKSVNTKTKNVSAAGVLFHFNEPLDVGSIINVKFLKPNSFDFFEGDAKVVRIEMGSGADDFEIGVEFIDLSRSDQQNLAYYISGDPE